MPFSAPTIRFTTAGLSAIPATGKTHDLSDAAVAGLILRVGPTGRKRWLFRFKWKGRPSRIKVGPFPKIGIAKARERALAHRQDLDDGIDPRRSARPALRAANNVTPHGRPEAPVVTARNPTDPDWSTAAQNINDLLSIPEPEEEDKHSVHFLVYEFVEFYVKPNREVPQEVIRILRKDVLPFIKNRDAGTVTSREINDRLDAIVARGAPVMANRTAPIISQMFSFGVHRSIVATNPVSLL
jgi:hypothetical protein